VRPHSGTHTHTHTYTHTHTQVCLQRHVLSITAVLAAASGAPEVRAKVKWTTLAAQASALRTQLLDLLTQDCNKMFLAGVFASVFQSSSQVETMLSQLAAQSDTYTNPLLPATTVAASGRGGGAGQRVGEADGRDGSEGAGGRAGGDDGLWGRVPGSLKEARGLHASSPMAEV
jgi:hypothetical protein